MIIINNRSLFVIKNLVTITLMFMVTDFLFAEPFAKIHNLHQLIVEGKSNEKVKSTSPFQTISSNDLQGLSVLQLSDVVKHFSGVTVKDYGGIGGLKTISVRSLGASHTAVSYDGITLSDCQTGQIDIGRFTTDNIETISLSNGQGDVIFAPARLMASASSLDIVTLIPNFDDSTNVHGSANVKSGSFGLIDFSGNVDIKFNRYLSNRFSSEYMYADGSYPYTLKYGESKNDSTSKEKRKNSDVRNYRLEDDVFITFGRYGNGNLKLYYYDSERGLPGATIYYNTDNFSCQRVWDKTFFVQSHYEFKPVDRFNVQINTKYNYGYLRYLDPTYLDSDGKEENIYKQREFYFSFSAMYHMFRPLFFALSSDYFVNKLDADLIDFAYPTRNTSLTFASAKWVSIHMTAIISMLFTLTKEFVDNGTAAENQKKGSPYLSFSYKPFVSKELYFRAFVKNIFRLPTFNDLYYSRIGNPNLKPENTEQYNIGLTYANSFSGILTNIVFTFDAYHNYVRNKIVAYPTKNIYQWTMLNYGKVDVKGIDFTFGSTLRTCKYLSFDINVSHTYMRSLNVTDATARDYKGQLPYTPRVSGSERFTTKTPWFNFTYSLVWSGKRYISSQNYSENKLPAYADHCVSLSKNIKINKSQMFVVTSECLNLLNKSYAVVKYFPMPGRSYRIMIKWIF